MPETTLPPSPRSDMPSRASFTSCPPEDDRESHASQSERHRQEEEEEPEEHTTAGADETEVVDEHAIAQQPTPEPDERETTDSAHLQHLRRTKEVELGSTSISGDSAGQLASPEPHADGEQRSAEFALSSSHQGDYLDLGWDRPRSHPNSTCSFLRPGSRFHGSQRSDRQVYDVHVEIKDVNMAESFLCGYLRIQGLTDDHPTLTTFFEGEIIGPKHLFKTTHASWGSTEKVDLQHWARFPAWRPLAKSAKSPNFTLKNYQQREHLFMRWKEYFLVPDHRVKTITGASFEGFYYICFNQCDGRVSGIYFHAKSEKYQQLELKHVEDHGCMGAMEFR